MVKSQVTQYVSLLWMWPFIWTLSEETATRAWRWPEQLFAEWIVTLFHLKSTHLATIFPTVRVNKLLVDQLTWLIWTCWKSRFHVRWNCFWWGASILQVPFRPAILLSRLYMPVLSYHWVTSGQAWDVGWQIVLRHFMVVNFIPSNRCR